MGWNANEYRGAGFQQVRDATCHEPHQSGQRNGFNGGHAVQHGNLNDGALQVRMRSGKIDDVSAAE